MNKTLLIGFICSLTAANISASEQPNHRMVLLQEAIESPKVTVSGKTDSGYKYVITQACSGCNPKQLEADESIKFYKNDTLLSPNIANTLNGQAATVLFDVKSKKVVRVDYFSVGEISQ